MDRNTLVWWPVDVVFRPERFVRHRSEEAGQQDGVVTAGVRITALYFVNLLLYATPLTLAGYGLQEQSTAPSFVATMLAPVGDPDAVWQFASALVQNSVFLLIATILAFCTFHLGIRLMNGSKGVLRSLRAVSYSTGIYLSVLFSGVWFLDDAAGFGVARRLLLWLQSSFIEFFINLVGADFRPPAETGRPELAQLDAAEQAVLTLLVISAAYFLYVLYVGARRAHDANRLEAVLATAFVLVSPALYVLIAIYLNLHL